MAAPRVCLRAHDPASVARPLVDGAGSDWEDYPHADHQALAADRLRNQDRL